MAEKMKQSKSGGVLWSHRSKEYREKSRAHARKEASKSQVLHLTNAEFAKNPEFIAACEAVDIPATARQASKFRNQSGKAYKGT